MLAAMETDGGDTSTETPADPDLDAALNEAEAPPADTGDASGQQPTGEQEWRFDAAEFDQAHPELAPYRKQLQGSFTKAQQELAEQRKQFEGIDPGDAAFLRQVTELATWNPQAAADLLDRARQQLLGPQASTPQPAPSPEEEPEFATEVERQLWIERETTRRELAEMRAWRQQETQARNMAQINEKFARLESEQGRAIPTEERNQVARWCMQNAKQAGDGTLLLPEVDWAWKLMNWDKVRQSARSEAAGSVERKAGISPGPSSLAHGDAPPREPKTQREALRAAMGLDMEE
jgi:hypothetical protein